MEVGDDLAKFVERSFEGKSLLEGLEAIEHHLAICSECQKDYQTLLAVLKEEE